MVDPLDNILQRRMVPEAPSNLAYRIIEASKQHAVQKSGDTRAWISEFFDHFLLPRPALAMAVVVLLGIYVGFSFQETYLMEEEDILALYADEGIEMGEWL